MFQFYPEKFSLTTDTCAGNTVSLQFSIASPVRIEQTYGKTDMHFTRFQQLCNRAEQFQSKHAVEHYFYLS